MTEPLYRVCWRDYEPSYVEPPWQHSMVKGYPISECYLYMKDLRRVMTCADFWLEPV